VILGRFWPIRIEVENILDANEALGQAQLHRRRSPRQWLPISAFAGFFLGFAVVVVDPEDIQELLDDRRIVGAVPLVAINARDGMSDLNTPSLSQTRIGDSSTYRPGKMIAADLRRQYRLLPRH
jgi:hypothetical protein